MFEGFQSQWTPILFSNELGKKKPVAARLAGEPLVLFRDRDGVARALIDRCPHRGVALSKGRLREDGRLECPFHGWRFEGDGRCAVIPFNDVPDDKRARMAATGLPVRERGSMIWVFTEPGATPEEPHVPEAIEREGVAYYRLADTWKTHWTRAMENMLDSPHLPIVHRRSIGAGLREPAERGDVMEVEVEPRDFGFTTTWTVGGEKSTASLDWLRPNGMALHLSPDPRIFRQHLWCVPIDATTTRMMNVSVRGFQVRNPIFWLFDRFNRKIIAEDRHVIETSDPPEVPDPVEEASVASDRATLTFRRWYLRTLRPSARSPGGDAKRRLDVAS